jgi:hypothetical protein
MTLFIASLLIYHLNLPTFWYIVAIILWVGHLFGKNK